MTGILVSMFSSIRSFVDGALPVMGSGGDTANITSAIGYFVQFISMGDYFFPVSILFTVIGIMMAYRIAMFLWFCINWVLRFIP